MREGRKNAFSRCLVGLALAAVAVDGAAAGRGGLGIGNTAHRETSALSNTGSISHDGGRGTNVAFGRGRDEVMKMAADRHEFFVYSSSGPTADPTDAASARKLSMEVEMKTGHQKSNKKDTQLDSPEGAHPAVMYPKKSDEDLRNVEPKPGKVHRQPTRPASKPSSDNR